MRTAIIDTVPMYMNVQRSGWFSGGVGDFLVWIGDFRNKTKKSPITTLIPRFGFIVLANEEPETLCLERQQYMHYDNSEWMHHTHKFSKQSHYTAIYYK